MDDTATASQTDPMSAPCTSLETVTIPVCSSSPREMTTLPSPMRTSASYPCSSSPYSLRVSPSVQTKSLSTGSVQSAYIKLDQALNSIDAIVFASAQDIPLNTRATCIYVSCKRYTIGRRPNLEVTSDCREEVFKVFRAMARKYGFPLAHHFSQESPSVGGWGLHGHFLLHLPRTNHASLRRELQQNLDAVFSESARSKPYVPVQVKDKLLGQDDTIRLLNYDLKGIQDPTGTYRRPQGQGPTPQGNIYGKRCGCSQSIDWGARRLTDYIDAATIDHLDVQHCLAAFAPTSGNA